MKQNPSRSFCLFSNSRNPLIGKLNFILTSLILLLLPAFICLGNETDQDATTSSSGSIIFSTYANDSWELWSIDPDGKNLIRLAWDKNDLHFPSRSSKSPYIAGSNNKREIVLVSPGEQVQKIEALPANCDHPAWAPSGDKLVCACYTAVNRQEDSDLWIYDVTHDTAGKLIQQNHIQSYPAWSPDGKHIVYTSGRRVGGTRVVESLWLVKADGTDAKEVISDGYYNIQPEWSPDGQWIAYASNKSGNMDIWVMARDGKEAKRLTFDSAYDSDPSWSPDGSRLCFSSTRTGQMEIWVMDKDGKKPRQLTGLSEPAGESMHPYWQK
nr:hypothetical protein [uncultured Desulfobulbus sp.]